MYEEITYSKEYDVVKATSDDAVKYSIKVFKNLTLIIILTKSTMTVKLRFAKGEKIVFFCKLNPTS